MDSKINLLPHTLEELTNRYHRQRELFAWVKQMPPDIKPKTAISMLRLHYEQDASINSKKKFSILNKSEFIGFIVKPSKDHYSVYYANFQGSPISLFEAVVPLQTFLKKTDAETAIQELNSNLNLPIIDFEKTIPIIKRELIYYSIKNGVHPDIEFLADDFFHVSDIHIPRGKSGVYFLFNENYELLYVGKAKSLRDRITSHVKGLTHVKKYCKNFHYVGVLYVDNYDLESELIETDLIRNLDPFLNSAKKFR
jgi:predicted GIY-YIG superfamily endonuclease